MRLLTAREVSVALNIPLTRVYELTRQNVIPVVRMGTRQFRYDPDALGELSGAALPIITARNHVRTAPMSQTECATRLQNTCGSLTAQDSMALEKCYITAELAKQANKKWTDNSK